MTSAILDPTFRDPAGSLSFEGDRVVRKIHPAARQPVLEFVTSAFCERLQKQGDMVVSTVDDAPSGLQLLHPKIPIPTYPWEWTPSQWLAAAELTLRLCGEALDEGWILKDATPLNILFVGPRPVLVDVLSFERRDPRSSLWLAYGQYMRTFLLPLLMNRMLHWPLTLSLFKRDGYEPVNLYEALGWRQRLSRRAFWPITLPAWMEKRKGESAPAKPGSESKDPEFTLHMLKRTLANLRRHTQRALPADSASHWSEYKDTLTHYTPAQSEAKRVWVRGVLDLLHPSRVLDVGANTGEFSAMAAEAGAQVVALERDAASAERIFRMSRERALNLQTIHADFARPTPAVGWENRESSALLPRLEGQFELVLMLAVIHHLILMEQIPLPVIVTLCHQLTRRHLVIEWVPVSDPMFQSLMRGRKDLYGALTADDLLAACQGQFTLLEHHLLDNGRALYLFEKK
jgi:SAM-dependent methyltransferase